MCSELKRFGLCVFFVFCLLLSFSGITEAASGQSVYLNDKPLVNSSGASAELIGNSVMIPIRMVVEELGYQVKWEQQSGKIAILGNDTDIELFLNKKIAWVNQKETTLDKAPLLRNHSTVVPLRFVGEAMGLKVTWDNKAKVARLYSESVDNISPEIESEGREWIQPSVNEIAEVNGISFSENRLMIALSTYIAPQVSTLSNPDRLVVDLPRTQFSAGFGDNQALDQNNSGVLNVDENQNISQVRYALFKNDPSTVRVVIDLKGSTAYRVSSEGSSVLIIDLNAPEQTSIGDGNKKIIVLDAGHGDFDPGTSGISGSREKDFNLSLVLKIADILRKEPNYDVVLTRSDDTYVTRPNRIKMANDLKASAFISIHANSVLASPAASGTESYYYKSSGKVLAETLHKHLVEATGFRDRKVKTNSFEVLRKADVPAVLLEVGFLSNREEEAEMLTEAFQLRVAQGLVDGIKEFLQ